MIQKSRFIKQNARIKITFWYARINYTIASTGGRNMRKSTIMSKVFRGFADILRAITATILYIVLIIAGAPIVWIDNIGRSLYRPFDAVEFVCAVLDLIPITVYLAISIPLCIYKVEHGRTDEEINNLTIGELRIITTYVSNKVYAKITLRGRYLKSIGL
jgi:hypothetical protein